MQYMGFGLVSGSRRIREILEDLERFLSSEEVSEELRKRIEEKMRVARENCIPIAKKRERGEMLTLEDVEKAMEITCWLNIAYCCGLYKKCPWRDIALAALGIEKEEYEQKERWVYTLLRRKGVFKP